MKRKIITLEVETEATHQEIKRYFKKKGKFVIKIDFLSIPFSYTTKHMTVIQLPGQCGQRKIGGFMKPRRVVVSLEIKTDAKLRNLEEIQNWDNATFLMDCNYFEFLEKPKVTVVNLKK